MTTKETPVVLLFEDDDVLCDVLQECFDDEGWEVLTFDALEALLQAAQSGCGTVAVVDGFGGNRTHRKRTNGTASPRWGRSCPRS